MASFKAKFPVLKELFAKNHRGGPLGPPPQWGEGYPTWKYSRIRCVRPLPCVAFKHVETFALVLHSLVINMSKLSH